MGQAVTEAIRNVTFQGVSGSTVALDQHGDRLESYEVMNYVLKADGAIGAVSVGLYNGLERTYSAYGRKVIWPGNTTDTPPDFRSSIVLGALLSNSGSWLGVQTIAGALPLAVNAINNDPSLLPGHELEFRWHDSGCSVSKSLEGLGRCKIDLDL